MKKIGHFLFFLALLTPILSTAKERILIIHVTIVGDESSRDADFSNALVEVTSSSSNKKFKPIIAKGADAQVLRLPLNKYDYTITVSKSGFVKIVYDFESSHFNFGEVTDESDYDKAILFVKMKKVSEGQSTETTTPEHYDIEFSPKSKGLVDKKTKKSLSVDYVARLMCTPKNKTQPEGLANGKVFLKDTTGKVIQQTQTNKEGVFAFHKLNPDNKYNVELQKTNDIPENAQIYMAKENGTIIQKLEYSKSGNSFQYKLLPPELSTLPLVNEDDDAELKVHNFSKSTEKEINIVQYIYYDVGKWDISPAASLKFDQIAQIMKDNPNLKLEVGSHTDSNGDDASNMKLSEKRAQTAVAYLVSKGVPAARLVGKGYGETRLINRCKNGVDCFDEEHAQNRRTEFRFIKP
jgi:outer membrane protein OmpA-like peptidoglycan-associated protein